MLFYRYHRTAACCISEARKYFSALVMSHYKSHKQTQVNHRYLGLLGLFIFFFLLLERLDSDVKT